jgi:hypothetical protein
MKPDYGERAENAAEEHLREQREEIAAETKGMATAYNALQPLSEYARRRALEWLTKVLSTYPEPPF